MGLFDIFKKKENNVQSNVQHSMPINAEKRDRYSLIINEEGKKQIDYFEYKPYPEKPEEQEEYEKRLDSTRLVIDDIINTPSGALYKCKVSWYNESDRLEFDPATGKDNTRRTEYRTIITQIDFDLLLQDPYYVKKLICSLLKKERVEDYLNNGWQDNSEKPCGEYVGHIEKGENGYKKVCDYVSIAPTCYNLPEMRMKREQQAKVRNLRERLKYAQEEEQSAKAHVQEIQKQINKETNDKER